MLPTTPATGTETGTQPENRGATTALASARARALATLDALFAVDARSLALTRIGAGSVVLFDLALRAADLRAFYSDQGLMPRAAWLTSYARAWSFHLLSGHVAVIALLFAAHAVAAGALLLGYRTRLATVVTWLLTASLHGRNPAILQGGDTLLLLILFWGMFVPWGARLSIDAAGAPRQPGRALSFGTAALLLQMPLVYLVAALQKNGPEWRSSFLAVYYALNDDFIASRLGGLLGSLPIPALQAMTVGTLIAELAIPLLLFSVVRTASARWIALALAATLQVGFAACFSIGLFPLVSTLALVPFVPASGWAWLERRFAASSVGARVSPWLARWRASDHAAASPRRAWPRRLGDLGCAFALALVLWANLASLGHAGMPRPVKRVIAALRLQQGWQMFIKPSKAPGWYVAVGTTADGRPVDLLAGTPAVEWEKPAHTSESFESYRWRKYFGGLRRKEMRKQHPALARYLCREHDQARPPEERLRGVALYYLTRPTDAGASAEPKKTRIFARPCRDDRTGPKRAPKRERPATSQVQVGGADGTLALGPRPAGR